MILHEIYFYCTMKKHLPLLAEKVSLSFQGVIVIFFQDEDGAFIALHRRFDKPFHGGLFIFPHAFPVGKGAAVMGHGESISFFRRFFIIFHGFGNIRFHTEPRFIAEPQRRIGFGQFVFRRFLKASKAFFA